MIRKITADIKIPITEEARQKARDFQNKVSQTETLQTPSYTGVAKPTGDAYFVAYLGEWGFAEYLKSQGITYEWLPQPDGKSDEADFIINNLKIDVKTASADFHKNLMMPLSQWNNKQQFNKQMDYYVGTRIYDKHIEIWGYISNIDFGKTEPKDFGYGLTIAYPLNKLNSVEELIEILKPKHLNTLNS